jgi:putative sigma-54 modulation protein
MQILLRARNVKVTQLLRAHVGERLGLALGRFAERIDKVTVHLMNAPPGRRSAEKRCRIAVGLRPRPISVEDADVDLLVALDRATERISRSVARALERQQALDQNPNGGLGTSTGSKSVATVTAALKTSPGGVAKIVAKRVARIAARIAKKP